MLREWDDAHPQRLASIFKAMQNVAPSQLADRELFDFETLASERDDSERLFEGDNIQVGQQNSLDEIGLPTEPKKQAFSASSPDKEYSIATNKSQQSTKIPTINPVL